MILKTELASPGVFAALMAIRGSISFSVFMVPVTGPGGGVRIPPKVVEADAQMTRKKHIRRVEVVQLVMAENVLLR